MRIVAMAEVLHELAFDTVAPGGRIVTDTLRVHRGVVDALPAGLAGIVVTADLQGVAPPWVAVAQRHLLGAVLAEELATRSLRHTQKHW